MEIKKIEGNSLEFKKALSLFNQVFDLNVKEKEFYYKHYQNPNTRKNSFLYGLIDKGEIVGITALIPVKANLNGEEIYVAQGVDSAVSKDYRRKGIFTKLVKHTIKQMNTSEGISFLYGSQGKKGSDLARKKLGYNIWEYMQMGQIYINPTKDNIFRYYTKKILALISYSKIISFNVKDYSVKEEKVFYEIENKVWFSCLKKYDFFFVKDDSYLNWRVKLGTEKYKILKVYKKSIVRGYLIFSVKNNNVILQDLVYDEINSLFALIKKIFLISKKNNINSIVIKINQMNFNKKQLKSAGFMNFRQKNYYKIFYEKIDEFRKCKIHLSNIDLNG